MSDKINRSQQNANLQNLFGIESGKSAGQAERRGNLNDRTVQVGQPQARAPGFFQRIFIAIKSLWGGGPPRNVVAEQAVARAPAQAQATAPVAKLEKPAGVQQSLQTMKEQISKDRELVNAYVKGRDATIAVLVKQLGLSEELAKGLKDPRGMSPNQKSEILRIFQTSVRSGGLDEGNASYKALEINPAMVNLSPGDQIALHASAINKMERVVSNENWGDFDSAHSRLVENAGEMRADIYRNILNDCLPNERFLPLMEGGAVKHFNAAAEKLGQ